LSHKEYCPECGATNPKVIGSEYDPDEHVDYVDYECRNCGEMWDAEYAEGE